MNLKHWVSGWLILLPLTITGQTLTLDSCQALARANYPLTRQIGLIEKTTDITLSNANKAYLPQVSLSAKATYQSDVTQIPSALVDVLSQLSGRTVEIAGLSKDQYQAVVELNQLIWDGGAVAAQKQTALAASKAEKEQIEVSLYALRDRINTLYFGVLLMDAQISQLTLLKSELAANLKRAEALQRNGVAMPADLDAIRVEQLNANQRSLDLQNARKTYLQLLTTFTGLPYKEGIALTKPPMPSQKTNEVNARPEIQLFDGQLELNESQRTSLYASNRPKLGLFVQGGYGKPGLNMFTNSFSPFYIGGVRLTWQLGGLYTLQNNLQKIALNQEAVEIQRNTFEFNNNLQVAQYDNEIEKLKLTLQNDEALIRLRTNIKKASETKWSNGTLTTTDLMGDINAESLAHETWSLHEIQLYVAAYQRHNATNQSILP